jgi:hypothetical protein
MTQKPFKKGDRVRTTSAYSIELLALGAFKGKVTIAAENFVTVQTCVGIETVHPYWLELDPDYQETPELKTDYAGCHPEIAASLKRGEHYRCNLTTLKGVHAGAGWVVGYCVGRFAPYISHSGSRYATAEPLPKTETRVIGSVEMMQGLTDMGYKPDPNGCFYTTGKVHNTDCFPSRAWILCGTTNTNGYEFEPWMLEEVEI